MADVRSLIALTAFRGETLRSTGVAALPRRLVCTAAVCLVLSSCTPARHNGRWATPATVATTASAPGAPPRLLEAVPAGAIDLGTLGGAFSEPTAMGGTVVVGFSGKEPGGNGTELGDGFAVNLATASPQLRDLGTLGAPHSRANSTDGTWVVGWASSADAPMRPFAYDLGAPHSAMLDLGTPASVPVGSGCAATAVRAGWVVGNCGWQTTRVVFHAFAYDLNALHPHMVDLGTLGGPSSTVLATDGVWAVGSSDLAGGVTHAFAYRLGAPHPVLQDLGALGSGSGALFVDAGWAVGGSSLPDGVHAFAYELNAAHPAMIDLGSLGGSGTYPAGLKDGWVVGSSGTPGGSQHAFVYDLDAQHPQMVDLGTLGGPQSAAVGVADGWVVGTASAKDRTPHLFAYDLEALHPQMVDLGTLRDAATQALFVGAGWVVGGATQTRSGYTGHAWAVRLPRR